MKYVLNTTGYKQLSYVGHSQGTTQTFAALSEDKTRSISSMMNVFIGLGPVTTPAHQTNIYITLLTEVLSELDFAFKVLGVNDFLPPFTGLFAAITDLLCLDDPSVCEGVIELICGKHQAAFNLSRMEVMVAHEPGGTSVKNMIHWGQLISSGRFQKFDYGVVGNLEMYNQTTAPLYDISQIDPKLPIALIYGLEDELADPVDVEAIIKTLPTPPIFVKELSTYSHLDFCWAIDAVTQFYQDVISILKKIN
jgi:pimeloyl-ACP methyl ester carboxylesterase